MTDADPILVTGAAGFIGFHVTRRLLERGRSVVGLDNLDPYYDVRLKEARLKQLSGFSSFGFERLDIADRAAMAALFSARRFSVVVHLAAQAGVRHSLVDPHAYVDANVAGFLNVLEGCRRQPCRHLVSGRPPPTGLPIRWPIAPPASSACAMPPQPRIPLRTRWRPRRKPRRESTTGCA